MPELDYTVYYRNWHDDSAEHARNMAENMSIALGPYLGENKHKPVLDIGCGMGFAMLGLQRLGYVDVQGIDVDAGQISVARKHELRVEQVTDTIGYLRQREETFGTILLLDVLEHVPTVQQVDFARSIQRALIPGGRLILQVPNATSILAARWRYNDYTHHSSFTEHSLRFVLANAGFSEVQISINKPVDRPSLRLWRKNARQHFRLKLRRYLVDRMWRSILRNELEGCDNAENIPTTLNLFAVAMR